ncbi:MAG TPA: peptide deformylase [Rubrobacteraceae bacterium]|jgi:peptide deformylase|nr:peptide deformylase [Rubrobacteraceae bacterium]
MEYEIRTFGDPVLKSRATPVKEFNGSLERLAEDMRRIMRENEGVGLAANQIGLLKRIFVASLEDQEYAIVNPVVEERSEETEKETEGCLSLPEVRVEVERPRSVIITGEDLQGEPVRIEAEGLLARVFQHEIDHLNGILILDRTDRESRKSALREIRERLVAPR